MKKNFQPLLVFVIFSFIPFGLAAQNNVGIGTLTPSFRLDVQGDPASMLLTNINSKVNYAGPLQIKAFEGTSITADGWGIGGSFMGGSRGVDALAQGGAYTGWAYGVAGNATGTNGHRVGVYGTASGGVDNYGLYGYADGGANYIGVFGQNLNPAGYAGYFDGRGLFKQELRADQNLVVDDTTWTRNIWSQTSGLQVRSLTDLEFMIDRNNSGSVSGFFEVFNGAGNHLFWINELGSTRTYGSHFVENNLGIGTQSPSTRLHIPAGNDASYTTHGFIQTGITDGWNIVLDDNEILARNNGLENELFIQRDGGDLLLCALEAGSVGIGLTAGTSIPAGYMLAVDGKIISEEIRVQNSTNWPDYVFAEEYDLMPLEELHKSILQHKHLPNIPSAEEVHRDGILIGDMQKKMMEKIEELTLYIIDLHQITKKQEEKIEALEAALHQTSKN
jgi:hypothetical protein